MTASRWVILPLACTVVPARVVNPLHRVLLHSLVVFPPGQRPEWAELAEKLRVEEPAFLDQAWQDLRHFRAVDHDDYPAAAVSVAGEAAVRRGWFLQGRTAEQRVTLWFNEETGDPGVGPLPRGATKHLLSKTPTWGASLSVAVVEQGMRAQKPQPGLRPGERLFSFVADWAAARVVT